MAARRSWRRIRIRTSEDVEHGLGGNLCRCGTYMGVRKAVLQAAKAMKGGQKWLTRPITVGRRTESPQGDRQARSSGWMAPMKASGRAKYSSDFNRHGMLLRRLSHSPHAHARHLRVDTSEAEKMPGVAAVHVGEARRNRDRNGKAGRSRRWPPIAKRSPATQCAASRCNTKCCRTSSSEAGSSQAGAHGKAGRRTAQGRPGPGF